MGGCGKGGRGRKGSKENAAESKSWKVKTEPPRPRPVPFDDDDAVEHGWRWLEITGRSRAYSDDSAEGEVPGQPQKTSQADGRIVASPKTVKAAGRKTWKVKFEPLAPKHLPPQDVDDAVELGWRWQEVTGLSGAYSVDSLENQGQGHQKTSEASANDNDSQPETPRDTSSGVPEPGDIVKLGIGAVEFRGYHGIITQVHEAHCTAMVMDSALRVAINQCWPFFTDVTIVDRKLRVGSRVVLVGMNGARNKQYNGMSGRIVPHPQQGHPSFIHKPSALDVPICTIMVVLDNKPIVGQPSVLVEPRFIISYEEYLAQMTCELAALACSDEP